MHSLHDRSSGETFRGTTHSHPDSQVSREVYLASFLSSIFSYVCFDIPWPCAVAQGYGTAQPPPYPSPDDQPIDPLGLIRRIFECLARLTNVRRVTLAALPPSGKHHECDCTSIQSALRGLPWRDSLFLDHMTGLEVSCAEFDCCERCTAALISVFGPLLARCNILKLGAIPEGAQACESPLLGGAETLHLRVDRRGGSDRDLFQSSQLSRPLPKGSASW